MATFQQQPEEQWDDGLEVELPLEPDDDDVDFMSDATGRSYDDLAERAQAVIDRTHAMEKPELEPDDASIAAQAQAAKPGPDADERPA